MQKPWVKKAHDKASLVSDDNVYMGRFQKSPTGVFSNPSMPQACFYGTEGLSVFGDRVYGEFEEDFVVYLFSGFGSSVDCHLWDEHTQRRRKRK